MRVLALTHGPSVGPGVIGEAVRDAGHELVDWRVPLVGARPGPADAVLVFGGAMHPDDEARHDWLRPELRLLEELLADGTPLFGICLGAQLLARAAGSAVLRAPEPEIGWLPVELTQAGRGDPLASSLPERFEAFQWHHYTYEVPPGAEELARSATCTQAFRLGKAWGVQFHPEVRAAQVEAWLAEEPSDAPEPEQLLAETRRRIGAWNELGRELCAAFLATV